MRVLNLLYSFKVHVIQSLIREDISHIIKPIWCLYHFPIQWIVSK